MDDFEVIQFFHENSKRNVYYIMTDPNPNTKPLSFKEFYDGRQISLPLHTYDINSSLENAIIKRKCCRRFNGKSISINTLSKILKLGYGILDLVRPQNIETFRRSSPSAGALYPFEIYPVVFNIEDLEKGIYHYSPVGHTLDLVKTGDFQSQLIRAFMNQYFLYKCNVCVILSSVLERTVWKYGSRGYRFVLLEAGHIIQNMILVSTSEGLGTLPLGGFYDNLVADLIDVDSVTEPVIYGLAIGHQDTD